MSTDIFRYREDFDSIKDDIFGESIRYKPDGGPWGESFSAIVEESVEGDIGLPGTIRDGHYFVTVSKTDVSSVKERCDVVEVRGSECTVNLIDTEDDSGWRLYCVR